MATLYCHYYNRAYNQFPNELIPANTHGGKLVVYYDTITVSDLEAGSTIYCFRPPKGARWVGVGRVGSTALGTGVTLSVGIPGNAVMFMPATSHASATFTWMGNTSQINAFGYEFDGNTDVIIVTGGAAATGTIHIVMAFSLT